MQTALTKESHSSYRLGQALSKVPEVTIWFWVIKVLCTTVGETAADYLNVNLNFGLTGTSVVTGTLLAVMLVLQFTAKRYVPWRYWTTVALVSVFGTLVTDNLTDHLKVRLETSTIVFSILLALTLLIWFVTDHSLAIHSIRTARREAFYWLAVLFSFALGTAAGDLMSERLGLGYLVAGEIVVGLIALTAVLWRAGMNPILGFWVVYIFTRPLGASIGDLLSQSRSDGGLGLGTTKTSVIFLGAILVVVIFLTVTKIDTNRSGPGATAADEQAERHPGGLWQTALYGGVLIAAGIVGYNVRTNALKHDTTGLEPTPAVEAVVPATGAVDSGSVAETAAAGVPTGSAATGPVASASGPVVSAAAPAATAAAPPQTKLGSLSTFRVIVQDTLDKLKAGDQAGATKRVDDLETQWDKAQARLQARDGAAWTKVDGKIDTVLRRLRATSPDPAAENQALTELLAVLV